MKTTTAALGLLLLFASGFGAQAQDAPQSGDVAAQQFSGDTRFTLITTGGFVGFTVLGDWHVIGMQSRPPVTATAFQIPDSADEGTPDSTNLVVSLLNPETALAKAGLDGSERKDGGTPQVSRHGNWIVHTLSGMQASTRYTIVDAETPIADVICRVRIAWPELPNHQPDYDSKMLAVFDAVLDSVAGGSGPYAVHQGETVRRPDPR